MENKPGAFIDRIGQGISWLNLALILIVCVDILIRELFKISFAWVFELEWHLFAIIWLIGSSYALRHDKHVRVDLFYSKFTPEQKALVDFWGTLLFLIPWAGIMGYLAFNYAFESFLIRENSPTPGGLPALYVIKFTVVLAFLLLIIQGGLMLREKWVLAFHRSKSI